MSLLPRFGHLKSRFLTTWSVLIIVSSVIGYVLHLQIHFLTMLTKHSTKTFQFDTSNEQSLPHHKTVIVSSYTKSGAESIGDLLGNRAETFYSIEPLISLGVPKYIKDKSTVCSYFRPTCSNATVAESYVKAMSAVLSCHNNEMLDAPYNQKWDGGGLVWLKYRDCLTDSTYNKELCDKYLKHQCMLAKQRVVKEDRISLRILGTYLKEHDDLTILHVFRDPRGIINEFIKGDKSSQKILSVLSNFASGVCSRMSADLETGYILATLYPKQFKMMLIEDFKFEMVSVARPLFRFLGYPVTSQDLMFIDNLQGKKADPKSLKESIGGVVADLDKDDILGTKGLESLPLKLNPFYWRRELSVEHMVTIDSACLHLYGKLGYNTYHSYEKMRNIKHTPSYGAGGVYPF